MSAADRTRREAFRDGVSRLRRAGVDSALTDSRILLAHATGTDTGALLTDSEKTVSADQAARYSEMIRRRCGREAVSRIIGVREFMSLPFRIDPDVLDPRPETELAVERSLVHLGPAARPARVLDVGTGSGAIAISLAVYRPGVRVVATHVSPRALRLAAANARDHGVDDRVRFLGMDLATSLRKIPAFDLIVSNPPYVSEAEFEELPPEVKRGDPRRALVAGPDGTEFYPLIASQAASRLRPGGALVLEVGAGQAQAVARFLGRLGYRDVATFQDLAGVERVVTGIMEHA